MPEDLMFNELLRITQWNKNNGIVDVTISADSINESNQRITTFILHRFPKGALQSQMNTHRSISKNSASSRAINKQKYVQNIITDPYVPIWTIDKKGMSGEVVLDVDLVDHYTKLYIDKMHIDIDYIKDNYVDIHKQDSNAQLDHYARIPIICTSTNWNYFFNLRCHHTTKPEFRRIALLMQELYNNSIPKFREFHIPWIRKHEEGYKLYDRLTLSTARSAWISYSNHQNLDSIDIAKNTTMKLWNDGHFSCFDHCAVSSGYGKLYDGWLEYRKWYD